MPTLADHPSSKIAKILNVGESGTGKTSALASLARAGYSLYCLDYDDNLGILSKLLADDKAALGRVQYVTLKDKLVSVGGIPQFKPPVTAFADAGKQLNEWTKAKAETGGWTDKDVLVLDTLNAMSDAALNAALASAGRLNQRPQLQDFGWLADSVLRFVAMICDNTEFPANVIVNTHVRYFEGDEDTQTLPKGLPAARGQQIANNVSRYFGTVLLTHTVGSGPATRRVISTQPQGVVQVKTSNPFGVEKQYKLENGLAELFEALRGKPGKDAPKPEAMKDVKGEPASSEPPALVAETLEKASAQ